MEPKSQPMQPQTLETDPALGLLLKEYIQQAINEQVNALKKEIKLPALGIYEAHAHQEQIKIENDKREKETLKTKGELEKMKKEVELLKAQLKVSEDELEEMKREKACKVRMDEIQKMFNPSCQDLDLAFLVHVDSKNEGKYGKACWKSHVELIKHTVANVATEMKKRCPQCTLRVAFAPYRDYIYHDRNSTKYDAEPCDFTNSFTGAESFFVRALTRVGAAGPAFNFKFEKYVPGFSWDATNRILIHIADYDYPPKRPMRLMDVEKEVKEAVGSSLIIVHKSFQEDISEHDVLKYVNIAVTEPDMTFQQEEVDITVPSWTNRPVNMSCSYCKHKYKWDPGMQNLISTVKDYKAIECEPLVEKVQVQIAEKPYCEVSRGFIWPYYAKVTLHQGEAFRKTIVHRFKTPEKFRDMPELQKDWHKRDHYLARMEVLSVAAQMAEEFNSVSSTLDNFMKLDFTQVTTLTVGSGDTEMFYNMETLEGDGVLCSNKAISSADTSDCYDDILQAFTHWTHHQTQGLLMVRAYSEGGRLMLNRHGEDVLKLCDPVIHCTDVMRFTTHVMRTDTYCNLGSEGFELFYKIHKCKDLCKDLQLLNPAIPVVETGI